MKKWREMSYYDRISWRIRGLWAVLALMLVYMVVISELGGGDSRSMTCLADTVSRVLFFGGMIWVIFRIMRNRKLLRNRALMASEMCRELDERNRYLHDKSGGAVMDILLLALLFTTVTTALFNMAAFYTAFAVLLLAVALKAGAYLLYSRLGAGE